MCLWLVFFELFEETSCRLINRLIFRDYTKIRMARFPLMDDTFMTSTRKGIRGDSMITPHPGGRWIYIIFVILCDGKLRGVDGWYLIKVRSVTVKKNSSEYFCIIKKRIVYMEYAIQSSMFYSFHLFLFILLCNVDSALVSDLNAYIWISNCILLGILNFIGKERGCLCWAWRNARGFSWTNVTKRDGGR